jgi:lactate permease
MTWSQNYDPLGLPWLSTLLATVPLAVLLGSLAILRMRAPYAALLGLGAALVVATVAFGMPVGLAFSAAGFGAAYGLLPIGWIVLNIIFLHQLTIEDGSFSVLQDSLTGISDDRRIQLLLIAFCFGAFFEGAAGFGTPVAVTGDADRARVLRRCRRRTFTDRQYWPRWPSARWAPLVTLAGVTDLPLRDFSAVVGRMMRPSRCWCRSLGCWWPTAAGGARCKVCRRAGGD